MNLTFRKAALFLIALLVLDSTSRQASADFATGFEAPTYVSGSIVGQDSWSGGTAPRVETATQIGTELTNAGLNVASAVHGGSQALLVTGTGGSSSTFRPVTGFETAANASLDVWARPLTAGSSGATIGTNLGNIFITMEDASGVRAAAFRFGATLDAGQLQSTSIDVFTEETNGWIPTGVAWQADTWYNMRLDADYAAKTYDVYIDGTKVNDDVMFYNTGSANLSQIRVFRGSGQAGMIVDDMSVIPEPSTLGLLLIAGSGILFKRRKPK